MIKYRAWFTLTRIEAFEVTKETEHTVFYKDSQGGVYKEFKVSDGIKWCDSWAEARDYLIQSTQKVIINLQDRISRSAEELAIINAMLEPVEKTEGIKGS